MRLRSLVINLAAIATFAAIALSLQFPRLNQRLSGQTSEDIRKSVAEEESRLTLIRQLPARGFGFNNLIANFAFLQFLQYFGDDVARNNFRTGYSLSPLYFRNIIDRDPRFISSYIYMSASVSMFAGVPSEADSIYAQGLRSLDPKVQSNAYYIWRYKATDQLLFLGDAKGSRESHLKAAEWADIAAKIDKSLAEDANLIARISRQSASWLEEERDLTNAQISAWSVVLRNATDRKTLQIVAQEVNKLGMKLEAQNGILVIVPKNPTK